jgi:hypothetical protein
MCPPHAGALALGHRLRHGCRGSCTASSPTCASPDVNKDSQQAARTRRHSFIASIVPALRRCRSSRRADTAFEMTASRTDKAKHGVSSFVRERGDGRPGTARLTPDPKIELQRFVVVLAASTAAEHSTVTRTGHTPLRRTCLCHDRSLVEAPERGAWPRTRHFVCPILTLRPIGLAMDDVAVAEAALFEAGPSGPAQDHTCYTTERSHDKVPKGRRSGIGLSLVRVARCSRRFAMSCPIWFHPIRRNGRR